MKQKEKLDLVLRKLYELRDDSYSHTLTEIMQALCIYENDADMRRLATRLEDERLAKVTRMSGGVDVEISTYGIDYYEENLSGGIRQSEKIGRILRWLYDRRHQEGMTGSLESIMKELGIFESREEAERIAGELMGRSLVTIFPVSDGAGLVRGITSKGISYCEDSSYPKNGQPTTSVSYHVTAHNAVVGNHNSHVQQSASITNEAGELVRKILEGISSESQLSKEEKDELMEHVTDIGERLESGQKVTGFQWKALIGSTANLASVADFAFKLAQLGGFLPPIPAP